MSKIVTGLSGFVLTIAALVAMYAWIPFAIKYAYEIFVNHAPVFSTFVGLFITFLLVEVVAVIVIILSGGLAMVGLSRKGK